MDINSTGTVEDSNTLFIILTLQILLLIERIFQNALKRIKHMKCSNCCSIDTAEDSPKRNTRESKEESTDDSSNV